MAHETWVALKNLGSPVMDTEFNVCLVYDRTKKLGEQGCRRAVAGLMPNTSSRVYQPFHHPLYSQSLTWSCTRLTALWPPRRARTVMRRSALTNMTAAASP